MKKPIAIIITLIFMFDGTGYCLPRTLVVCGLRPPLSFSAEKKQMEYLCKMLAIFISKSMRRTMGKNKAINTQALDIGVTYTEFTPKRLLKESMPEKEYDDLITRIEKSNIKMDIDKKGNIWVSYEPNNIYIRINKDGYFGYRIRAEFYDATERGIKLAGIGAEPILSDVPAHKIVTAATYPGAITAYDKDGNKLTLSVKDLLDKKNKEACFIIRIPQNNIRLVSFEYEDALEGLKQNELSNLFTQIHNNIHLKIAITARSERVFPWLRALIEKYPEINNCIDFSHVDRSGVDIKSICDEAHIQPQQIMHFSKTRASSIHTQGFVSVMIAPQEKLLSSFVMQRIIMQGKVDAVIIGGKRINNIMGLVQQWTKVAEKEVIVKPASGHYDGRVKQILINNPEFGNNAEAMELLEKIQSNPNDLIARNRLGSLCVRKDKHEEAVGICLDLLDIISSRRIEPKGHTEGFLDKNEEIAMRTLVSAYHGIGEYNKAMKMARRLIEEFPKNPWNNHVFMTSCVWTGNYSEGIAIGEKAIEEYPDDASFRRCLVTLYLDRALKKSMLGEEYEADFKRVTEIADVEGVFTKKAEHLGIRKKNGNGHAPYKIKEGDIAVENLYTGEKYALTGWTFDHILSEHTGEAREFGLNRTLFPVDIDNETVKELVTKTARFGINMSRSFPWGSGDILVWYVEDNDPDLAAKSGVSRMEIVIHGGVIITGYPNMGERIRYVNKHGDELDKGRVIIHASVANFIWNKDSKRPALLVVGDSDTDLGSGLTNNVFGNMERIWREWIILHALWEGKFLGYDESGNAEIYKYKIPDEHVQKYNLSDKVMYVYLDTRLRRLLHITGQEPRIIRAVSNGNGYKKPEQSNGISARKNGKPIKAYSLTELQQEHRIAGKLPSIDDLQERWEYYYDESRKLFYDNESAWREARKDEPEDMQPEQSAGVNLSEGAVSLEPAIEDEPLEQLLVSDVVDESLAEESKGNGIPNQDILKQRDIAMTIQLTRDQKAKLRSSVSKGLRKEKYKDINLSGDELEILVNIIEDSNLSRDLIDFHIRRFKALNNKIIAVIVEAVLKFKEKEFKKPEPVDLKDLLQESEAEQRL